MQSTDLNKSIENHKVRLSLQIDRVRTLNKSWPRQCEDENAIIKPLHLTIKGSILPPPTAYNIEGISECQCAVALEASKIGDGGESEWTAKGVREISWSLNAKDYAELKASQAIFELEIIPTAKNSDSGSESYNNDPTHLQVYGGLKSFGKIRNNIDDFFGASNCEKTLRINNNEDNCGAEFLVTLKVFVKEVLEKQSDKDINNQMKREEIMKFDQPTNQVFSMANHTSDSFVLNISIEGGRDFHLIPHIDSSRPTLVWLSYQYLDILVQTEKFQPLESPLIKSRTDPFQIFGSLDELLKFMDEPKNGLLQVYVCCDGFVLGHTNLDINLSLGLKNCDNVNGRNVRGQLPIVNPGIQMEYSVLSSVSADRPSILMALSLEQGKHAEIGHSQRDGVGLDALPCPFGIVSPVNTALVAKYEQENFKSRTASWNGSTEDQFTHHEIEKRIAAAEAEIERRRRMWEEFRHKEEIKFHESLKRKEEAGKILLEQQLKNNERDRVQVIESYKRLESRLKKSLLEVEDKERKIRSASVELDTTYKQKVAQLESREKIVREESKHMVNIEKAKVEAAIERVKVAEKAADAANARAKQAERDLEDMKKKMSESNEATMLREITVLKTKLAEINSQIQRARTEKNEMALERDRYRMSANKLAKMIRRERSRTIQMKSQSEINIGQDELQRIKNELNSINNIESMQINGQVQPPHNSHHMDNGKNNTETNCSPYQIQHKSAPYVTSGIMTPPHLMTPPRYPLNGNGMNNPRLSKTFVSSRARPIAVTSSMEGSPFRINMHVRPASDSKAERLKQERESLLATGVYNIEHPIVRKLDDLFEGKKR